MIAYDLQCLKGHTFEGWFEDEKAYKNQKSSGLLTCPICNDTEVSKIPSTFAIKAPPATGNQILRSRQLEKISQKVANYVVNNFDDVGCDFSKEALKIHYGVSEPRNIRGMSTEEEEKTMKGEGIQFFKIPLPETPETPETDS